MKASMPAFLGLGFLLVGIVPVAGADTDKDKLQGTWKVVSLEQGGKKLPEEQLKQISLRLVFAGDRVTFKVPGQDQEGSYKIDSAQKPKHLDILLNNEKGEGVYLLDGDTLTICAGKPGDPRPKEFVSKQGTEIGIMVLKREK